VLDWPESPMAIDDPIALSDLLDVPDLRDVVRSFAVMHGVTVSVIEKPDRLLTTTAEDEDLVSAALKGPSGPAQIAAVASGAALFVVPLMHQGEVMAKIAIGPYTEDDPAAGNGRARAIASHLSEVLEILVHNAFARHITATMHTAAMEANFAELSAKNKRLEKAVERMQEADRLKSTFLATMSHELRTPLTSVIGYSEMLIEGLAGEVNDEQREYLKTILSKADQLLQLISSILDVSMLESASLEMQREPVTLRKLVDSVLTSLGEKLRKRRITVKECQAGMPRVVGDSRQLREVLRNLLTNAIKFTSDGSDITITLDIGALKPDGVDREDELGVRLVVTDSGIGISPEEQANIFEPFFQVDSSSTRQYGGSGLGLTLAKRYIEAHGGHIWVDSSPGQGSAFTVSLPAVADELRTFLDGRDLASPASVPGE
jgi:two-component system, NarL family, sensor histidine kinase BarA